MSATATFRHGDPVMIDHTPAAGAVTAGQIVVLGNVTANTAGTGALACIAHCDIANNVQGALACGGGVYDIINLNNAANGAKVFYDASTPTKVTTTSTNNAQFGYVVENGGGGANSTCSVFHDPRP